MTPREVEDVYPCEDLARLGEGYAADAVVFGIGILLMASLARWIRLVSDWVSGIFDWVGSDVEY